MFTRYLALVFSVAALAAPFSTQVKPTPTPSALTVFAERLQAYAELRARVAREHPELAVLADYGEIRRRTDLLAAAIVEARRGARQGDVFTPEIAVTIRRLVRYSCDRDFAQLLMLTHDDLDRPLPPPMVNGRWPIGAPLPTMMPDLLAELPRLPAELEYRFVGGDLILLDIDACLIVDVIPDVIPLTS